MSLPAGVTGVTVSSAKPLTLPDGTPYEGTIFFDGPDLVTIAGQDVVLGGTVAVDLVAGEYSVVLAANDDAGVSPSGWTYKVRGQFTNAPGWVRYIALSKNDTSVSLADVLVPDPVTGEFSTLVDPSALLAKAQNLGDVPDKAAARGNLGLGGAAVLGVGTTADTVAAGDDPRFAASKPWVFDITDLAYGAVGDAKIINDGAIIAGTAVLTSPSNKLASAAVGMHVSVKDAGPTGVTTHIAQIASVQSDGQVTLDANAATTVSGAIVIFGTDDTAAIQAAVDAAEAYLVDHTYAQVYFPPRPYIVAGPLNTSKDGNGQIVFGVYPTTDVKRDLEFRGEGDGAAVRHWEQTLPQYGGSCLISLGVYASIPAQASDINANGNPAVISGPNEGTVNGLAYGASARFSNIVPALTNLAILNTHSSFGLSYGAYNFFGTANTHLTNVGWSSVGVVPGTDFTSPGLFANGLSIGGLLPAAGNNDEVIADNVCIGGGYTWGVFLTEHLLCTRIVSLYCWSAIALVGTYAGSVGSVHAMLIESASVENCINEIYIVGAGSGGVGPIIDILQFSTESSTPNIAGNSQTAVNSALGKIKLTGIFSETGVSTQYPTGIEFKDGQVPLAIKKKTASFTASPIDRTLICDTSAGAFTGTLPAADFCPVQYVFRNVGANTLTVATTSSQPIHLGDGTSATSTALANGQSLRVEAMYDGTEWGWYAI